MHGIPTLLPLILGDPAIALDGMLEISQACTRNAGAVASGVDLVNNARGTKHRP